MDRKPNPTKDVNQASIKFQMKRIIVLLIILIGTIAAAGQQKPLTQAEYVKMLYALQQSPGTKAAIISSLRARGIDFVVTEGIRGLTRSKSGNDEEIRRALDEADRRRQNPETAKIPGKVEADKLLSKTRLNTLAALEDMPDFVVKQQIQRSAAYAGTGTFRSTDNLIVAVSYRSSGEEEYKLLMKDGVIQNDPKPKQSYEEAGGTSSTGEFVTVLATIFKPESETLFNPIETDVLRGRKAVVFEFSITKDKARQSLTAVGYLTDSTISGMTGRLWIDTVDARVLRIESEATEIPPNFPIPAAKRNIDYDWIKIADGNYLLPSLSDVRLTIRQNGKLFETRNLIKFKNYQKYGTDVIIVDDDSGPIKP